MKTARCNTMNNTVGVDKNYKYRHETLLYIHTYMYIGKNISTISIQLYLIFLNNFKRL